MPAIHLMVKLFPQPHSPSQPTVSLPASISTSRVNAGEALFYGYGKAHCSAPLRYLVVRLLHKLMNQEHDEAESDNDRGPEPGNAIVPVHPFEVDGDGNSAGDAQIVACQEATLRRIHQVHVRMRARFRRQCCSRKGGASISGRCVYCSIPRCELHRTYSYRGFQKHPGHFDTSRGMQPLLRQ